MIAAVAPKSSILARVAITMKRAGEDAGAPRSGFFSKWHLCGVRDAGDFSIIEKLGLYHELRAVGRIVLQQFSIAGFYIYLVLLNPVSDSALNLPVVG